MSKSSSNYFDDAISLVYVDLGGIKYCNIHMRYTSGMKILIISFLCQWQRITGQIIAYSNFNFGVYQSPTTECTFDSNCLLLE